MEDLPGLYITEPNDAFHPHVARSHSAKKGGEESPEGRAIAISRLPGGWAVVVGNHAITSRISSILPPYRSRWSQRWPVYRRTISDPTNNGPVSTRTQRPVDIVGGATCSDNWSLECIKYDVIARDRNRAVTAGKWPLAERSYRR